MVSMVHADDDMSAAAGRDPRGCRTMPHDIVLPKYERTMAQLYEKTKQCLLHPCVPAHVCVHVQITCAAMYMRSFRVGQPDT